MQSINQTKGFYIQLRVQTVILIILISDNKMLLVLGAIRGDKQTVNQILMLEKNIGMDNSRLNERQKSSSDLISIQGGGKHFEML